MIEVRITEAGCTVIYITLQKQITTCDLREFFVVVHILGYA